MPHKKLFNCGSGGWIWTNDLRVMSPTSYQTAPPRNAANMKFMKVTLIGQVNFVLDGG